MNREKCLQQAMGIVGTDRYGSPENNFRVIANLWEIYLGEKCVEKGATINILQEDVAAMMALMKIARVSSSLTSSADCWVDLAGYAACGCELATD